MHHRGRGWRWGARPAIVALASVAVGYFTNVVSSGNHSVAAIAGFGFAVVALTGSVWWDSARQATPQATSRTAGSSVVVDQRIGTARDSSLTAVDIDGPVGGDYDLRQRVDRAEHTDVSGLRRRSPGSSAQQP